MERTSLFLANNFRFPLAEIVNLFYNIGIINKTIGFKMIIVNNRCDIKNHHGYDIDDTKMSKTENLSIVNESGTSQYFVSNVTEAAIKNQKLYVVIPTQFSACKMIQRGLLGLAIVIFTLGLGLLAEPVRQLCKFKPPVFAMKLHPSFTTSCKKNLKRKKAKTDIAVIYKKALIIIPQNGRCYYSIHGEIGIGFHGTYNPPSGHD